MRDDKITIETPERIEVEYELAGLGSRALAGLLDTFFQAVITGAVVYGLWWLSVTLGWQTGLGVIMAIIIGTTGFLAATAYFVLSEMLMGGQSLGKRMAGLRVVRDDGSPITFLDSALRNIIRVVDMLPFFYTVGLISVFATTRCKRVGDIAAGTIVVKERLYEAPPVVDTPRLQVPRELEILIRGSIHLLTEPDVQAAEHFLGRRFTLDVNTRQRLGQQVAEAVRAKLGPGVPPDYPAEMLLEAVVQVHRDRPL